MEYLDQIRPFLERLLPRAANANATDVLSTPPPPPVELPPSALGDNAIFVAYAALLAMAVAPIILGSRSSVDFKTEKGKGKGGKAVEEKEEEREFFRLEDAKMFPLIGSATLFGLYLLFTYFDKEYVNYLLTGYFAIIGVGAMVKMIMAVSRAISGKELKGEYRIDMWKGETGGYL